MLLDEVRKNPLPFAFWASIHTAVMLWLFLNKDCSLCNDVSKRRFFHPLTVVVLVALNGVLYFWTLASSPQFWEQPETAMNSYTSGANSRGSFNTQDGGSFSAFRPGGSDSGSATRDRESWREMREAGGVTAFASSENSDANLLQSQCNGNGSFSRLGSGSAPKGPPSDVERGDFALPLRSKYCWKCKAYVMRHDHHCPFLGGCIGLGNHRTFYLFIAVQTGLTIYTAVLNLECFRKETAEASWVVANGLPILVMIVCVLGLMVLLPLFLFHTYLISANTTTYEVLARDKIWYLQVYPAGVNPFNKGILANLRTFFTEGVERTMPTMTDLEERQSRETLWDNRYYSCCG